MYPQLLNTLCKVKALALTSAPLLFFLPVLWSHALPRDSPVIINTTSGGQCVLPCPCPLNSTLLLLQWIHSDLKGKGYVFNSRNSYQHPSYHNRVHLKDPHSNSCDVVLKNVTSNDTGVYECWARCRGSTTALNFHYVIQLRVKDLPGGDNRDQRVKEQPSKQRSRYGLLFSIGFILITSLICATSKLCQKCRIRRSSKKNVFVKNRLSPKTTPFPPKPPSLKLLY